VLQNKADYSYQKLLQVLLAFWDTMYFTSLLLLPYALWLEFFIGKLILTNGKLSVDDVYYVVVILQTCRKV